MSLQIGDYALLSDCQSAALVGRDGSVDWWCAPRFDSRSCFARILDDRAGHWAIHPTADFEPRRAYLADTMVLRTDFHTTDGVVRLADALLLSTDSDDHGHHLGRGSPHVLARLIEGLSGRVRMRLEFCPRLEYGLTTPGLRIAPGSIDTVGGPDRLRLTTEQPWQIGSACRATLDLVVEAGDSYPFTLTHGDGMIGAEPGAIDVPAAIDATIQGWRSWTELHRGYDGFAAEQVRRSSLVLQALTFQPTGAIVAAPTTSLPEIVGGTSNWDYRYGWLRDSSITLKALWVAACPDEAERYFRWMALASGSGGEEHVQVMFGLQGERDLSEHYLEHLRGYQNSRPVRVGNDAWKQRQLDVLGEVLEAAWTLRDQLDFDNVTAKFLCRLADNAARSWQLPDSGLWEGREGERHYTASKLMCWVALDRACKLATRLRAPDSRGRWAMERDQIAAAIMEQAWSDEAGAFTGAFGSSHLDAAVLLMPLVGFLPATDPRFRRTIETLQRELGEDGLLRRWTGAQEGAFVICSYWLAECLALAGEPDRARDIFVRVGAHANDVGLLAEQIDPASGQLLSNFPQTFSHAGLINAAWAIEQTRSNRSTRDREDTPRASSPTE